jgi:outer membrane lipoprotein-sorting protein
MLPSAILLGLFTFAAAAQTNVEASALLNEIATSALAAKSWRVEGFSTTSAASNGAPLSSTQFKIARQGRIKVRLEILGPNPILIVYDGAFQTAYFKKSGGSTKTPATEERCANAFFRWEIVADSIHSAAVTGHAFVAFEGRNQECTINPGRIRSARPLAFA